MVTRPGPPVAPVPHPVISQITLRSRDKSTALQGDLVLSLAGLLSWQCPF